MKRGKPPIRRTRLRSRAGLGRTPAPKKRPRDTGPSRRVRQLVLKRDRKSCGCCGRSVVNCPFSLQHRRARGAGGSSDPAINLPSNTITMCGSANTPGGCHLRAEQRDPGMVAAGFVVSLNSRQNPADIPVQHAIHGLVLLLDDGTVQPVGEAA